jgi:hypothetical protein
MAENSKAISSAGDRRGGVRLEGAESEAVIASRGRVVVKPGALSGG